MTWISYHKFQTGNRISRKHNFQLVQNMPRDGSKKEGFNRTHFIIETLKGVVGAKDVNNFKQKLDEA